MAEQAYASVINAVPSVLFCFLFVFFVCLFACLFFLSRWGYTSLAQDGFCIPHSITEFSVKCQFLPLLICFQLLSVMHSNFAYL